MLVQLNKYYAKTGELLEFYQENRHAFGPHNYHAYFFKLYGVHKSEGAKKEELI